MALEALKRNGHNLDLGQFELDGDYGIPKLSPVHLDERIGWIRFNHALKEQDAASWASISSLTIISFRGSGTTLPGMPCSCAPSGRS